MRLTLRMKFQRKTQLEHRPQRNQIARLIAALDMVLERQMNENKPNITGEIDDSQENSNLCQSFISEAKR